MNGVWATRHIDPEGALGYVRSALSSHNMLINLGASHDPTPL